MTSFNLEQRFHPPRALRRPFFTPVVCTPMQLVESWTENISSRGIGVAGRLLSPEAELPRGMIEVRFDLPDGSAVDVGGIIAWSRRTSRDAVALGISLTSMSQTTAQKLARFAAEFRFRVVVVGADAALKKRIDDAAGAIVALEHVDTAADVPPFDVAAVVACGALPAPPADIAALEFAPPCIALTDAADAAVLAAYRARCVACALPLAADGATIRAAIVEACRESSVRAELRATMFRFAGDLHRRAALARAALDKSAAGRSASDGNDDAGEGPSGGAAKGEGGALVADSAVMRAVLEQVRVVARRKVVVLFEGETGAGKEVLARELHARSDRAERPLVVQDCGTLTDTLLDSELFGHVRGAFTGANADHPGLFVIADGGTIFLDEIENTTPALQAKLLRVIETGQLRPVGGTRARVVDVRVIAATNRNLWHAVQAGRFRADLYYRLTVFPIVIPPLRARGRDVARLAEQLASDAARAHGLPAPALDDDALAAVLAHEWPGNVRQLKNAMERAVLLSGGGTLSLAHLPEEVRAASAAATAAAPGDEALGGGALPLSARVDAFEKREIERALAAADGVISKAARALGANRITFARRMKQLDARPPRA